MRNRDRPHEDLLMITFDALRFDVARTAMMNCETPFLSQLLPSGWEERHSPGNFTFASHAAFFAGFWPTLIHGEPFERPFALRFTGSRTVGKTTTVFDNDNLVSALADAGYRTICIGGVGFFNKLNALGSLLPSYFQESHWEPAFSVSQLHSTKAQVRCAVKCLSNASTDQPVFLFLNVSATHPPTRMYSPGEKDESVATQRAALSYVDRQLAPLFEAFRQRNRGGRAFLMSDHGTLFGEDGLTGHRIGHERVWTVPYGEYIWEAAS